MFDFYPVCEKYNWKGKEFILDAVVLKWNSIAERGEDSNCNPDLPGRRTGRRYC